MNINERLNERMNINERLNEGPRLHPLLSAAPMEANQNNKQKTKKTKESSLLFFKGNGQSGYTPTKLSDKSLWSPSFPRQSLARRRARNIVLVHAHALNGSWECYHVVRIGLGAIWGDHGRRRSLHFTTPPLCLKKGWVYPLCLIPFF